MQKKNDIDVIINNKRYTLCGYESQEYLQKIASYLNGKYAEFKDVPGYNMLGNEQKSILLQINIADDYFKLQQKIKEVKEESEWKSNEIFDMKHEVIGAQTRLENVQRELANLKSQLNDAQKQIIKLETELEERSPLKKRR